MSTEPLNPISIRDFNYGMIQGVENPNMPDQAVRLAVNVNFDRISIAELRDGYTVLGSKIVGGSTSTTFTPVTAVDGRVGRDTTTVTSLFNPSALTAVDGRVFRSGVNETFSTIRSSAGNGNSYADNHVPGIRLVATTSPNQYSALVRAILLFDTSALPAGTITAATLGVVYSSKATPIGDLDTVVVASTPASNTVLANSDYANLGSTALSNLVNSSSITADDNNYTTYTLNASGIAAINAGGITKMGLMLDIDRSNTTPTWSSGALFNLDLGFSEGTNKPVLTITYTTATNETLTTIITSAGSTANSTESSGKTVMLKASTTTNQYTELRRGVFEFDTSTLPPPAVITSATLRLYVNSVTTTIGSQSVGVTSVSTSSTTTLIASDYANFGSTRLSTDKTIASLSTTAYNDYTLNAAGLAAINKNGISAFGVRLASDIDQASPTWGSGNEASVNVDFSEGTNKPQLVITYNVGTNTLGLHQYLDPAGTNSQLMAQVGGVIYYKKTDGTWQSLDNTRNNALKERFTNAVGYVFYTNGSDVMKTWNGAGSVGTVNAVNAPRANYLEFFKGKVYAAGTTTNPDRVYFSSIPSTSLAITWDTTNDYFDINPSDGENISGMKRFTTELLIFKKNNLYRFYGVAGSDPDALFKIGTYSNESIVVSKAGCAFHHPTGIFLYSGGKPDEISRPIRDVINGISRSEYGNIAGWTATGSTGESTANEMYWSVGDVTIEGVVFSNVVIRYSISTQVWTVYSYFDRFLFGISYDDGVSLSNVVADTNSTVHTQNSGMTDNGNPIFYSLITKWYEGDTLSEKKNINQIRVFCEKGSGMGISYQVDSENINSWHPLGKLTGFLTNFGKNPLISGYRIRFKLHGSSSGKAWRWLGMDLISGVADGLNYDPLANTFPKALGLDT